MAKLFIKTSLEKVYIIGEFCNWDMNKIREVVKKSSNKCIVVDNMPIGEYKVLRGKSYAWEEKTDDGRTLPNRVFVGNKNQTISVNL